MDDIFNVLRVVWNGLFAATFDVLGFTVSFGQILIFVMFTGIISWFIGRTVS